jgi:threonylcarbamoyladenosine tRNA methylthiotransferase MtaB
MPLQSGSDRILAAMNRNYSSSFYLERVHAARAILPDVSIGTDVIVGFPGETDEDFAATLELCSQAAFARVHTFRYSPRKGTVAASMNDQVAAEVKAARSRQLRELASKLAKEDALRRIDSIEQVLVEKTGRGTSESYHGVKTPKNALPGGLYPMRLASYSDTLFSGKMIG